MRTLRSLGLIAALAAVATVSTTGCGTEPASTSVVCTDFRAGADLSQSTFGVTGDLQRSYVAFAQAAGDLAAVANEILRDVGTACQGLALDLGARPDDARVRGLLEPDAVRMWCAIAAERFEVVRPKLVAAHFAVQVVTPKCSVDASFQVDCEKKCSDQGSCTESTPEERCPADAREGICDATCTGTCTGSETAPATCEGACDGTCFGTCGDAAPAPSGDAFAAGDGDTAPPSDATDCSMGCACTTTCHGSCTAACALPAAGARCDAVCAGTCSAPMLDGSCTAALAPPKCAGDVDCQNSCSASSAARADCPDGSLAVHVDEAAQKDVAITQIVGALERNLPPIFLAARGRAKVLSDGASSLVDAAGHILSRADAIGPMGAACGLLIGQTSEDARKSLDAAEAGSNAVAHAVTSGTTATPKP